MNYGSNMSKDHPDGKIASGDYYLFCKGDWIDAWWKRSHKQTCTRIDFDRSVNFALAADYSREAQNGRRETSSLAAICCKPYAYM